MRRAAIVAPRRTPIGAFGGALRPVPVEKLGAAVAKAVVEATGIDPQVLDEVIFGQSYSNGETPCTGRWIALEAGFPIEVAGLQLDRRCGTGLQSVATAAMMVQTGAADVVLAGGVESMSNVEYYSTTTRWGARFGSGQLYDRLDRGRERSQPVERFGKISGMIETAENVARRYSITREASDELAARSHQSAARAWDRGAFDEEIVPIEVPQRRGRPPGVVDRDEGIRPDSTPETLAALRPVREGGVVTPGNACQQNDAAAACLVLSEEKAGELGLQPIAYLSGWAAAGCEPAEMGLGPVPATARLLDRLGLGLDDMDLIEVNEAFACQVLGVAAAWGLEDLDRLNVNGSGISLGHPVGATGIRIMTSMLHELRRRDGRYALETMCIGGGQGLAAVFESAS